jgi:hypothetical protein
VSAIDLLVAILIAVLVYWLVLAIGGPFILAVVAVILALLAVSGRGRIL